MKTHPTKTSGLLPRLVSRLPVDALTRILEKAETDAVYALRVDSNDTYQRGDVARRQKWEQRAKDIKAVQVWLAEQTANQRKAEAGELQLSFDV